MRSIRLILTILTALAALSASGAKPPPQTGSQVLESTEPVPQYQDGRPTTKYRLEAIDQGVVLRHGNGPGKCDYLGARDIWVFKDGKTWHMYYLGTPNVTPAPNLVPMFPYQTMKAKGKSPSGPWTKQKEVV